jgi:hypothetical protein
MISVLTVFSSKGNFKHHADRYTRNIESSAAGSFCGGRCATWDDDEAAVAERATVEVGTSAGERFPAGPHISFAKRISVGGPLGRGGFQTRPYKFRRAGGCGFGGVWQRVGKGDGQRIDQRINQLIGQLIGQLSDQLTGRPGH